ncbi:MAG: DNA polymerase IV [Bacteroidetes bacterium]|nr:DNA polymerase IV [Bacteroidota bacterium]
MLFDQPDKTIVHFDLDTFFVSVERRINSALEGKPLLIGGTSERGVVGSCSYEARAFGVQNGMAMKEARRLCPEAIVVRGDAGKYSNASGEVTQIIRESVPLMEKASVDEFYLDMTGMDRIFGIEKYTKELRQRIIRETHLPISMGISGNKSVSKIATSESKPSGELTVLKGTEKGFLAPLSVRKLPLVGNETYQVLQELGIRTIHTLQQMPVQAMENVLGKNGETIWLRAQGIDNTPLKPYYERESLSLERTFGQDTMDLTRLNNTLTAMAEGLAYQLRAGNKLTACITVKVRYADMQVYTKQVRIPYSNCDHTLLARVKEIFAKLYQRRQLIRLIGVSCSHLVGGGHQMNMLEDSAELIQLYHQMDKIRKKYHDSRIIKRACTMDQRNLDVWDPWNGEPPVPGGHRTA